MSDCIPGVVTRPRRTERKQTQKPVPALLVDVIFHSIGDRGGGGTARQQHTCTDQLPAPRVNSVLHSVVQTAAYRAHPVLHDRTKTETTGKPRKLVFVKTDVHKTDNKFSTNALKNGQADRWLLLRPHRTKLNLFFQFFFKRKFRFNVLIIDVV